MNKAIIAAFSWGLLAGTAHASERYKIDPAHAWVYFTINHSGWANAIGRFDTIAGDISFDKDDVTRSTVKITIDTTSVNTNQKARDDHLRSPDFFNAAEFPSMTFESTAIAKTGDKTAKITGNLTLLGVSKPVTLDARWNAEAPYPFAENVIRSGFSATGVVSPAEFGMTKVTEFGMGPEVYLMIEIEADRPK
jgi:polyisoprenoid-binding protein YceI